MTYDDWKCTNPADAEICECFDCGAALSPWHFEADDRGRYYCADCEEHECDGCGCLAKASALPEGFCDDCAAFIDAACAEDSQ